MKNPIKMIAGNPVPSAIGAAAVTGLLALLWPNKTTTVINEQGTSKTESKESKWSMGKISAVGLGTVATLGAATSKLWGSRILTETVKAAEKVR